MTLDGNVTTPEKQNEEPYLYQTQDNSTAADQNSTRSPTQIDAANEQGEPLIAMQEKPVSTALIFGIAGIVAAAVCVSTLLMLKRRKAI
jgi:hypothetical protein